MPPYYRQPGGKPVRVLHAREYTWRPADGVCIPKWGYEGFTPGPTIRAKAREPSELVVYNELPERLYNPYLDTYNPITRTKPLPSPIKGEVLDVGPDPDRPPAPYDADPTRAASTSSTRC